MRPPLNDAIACNAARTAVSCEPTGPLHCLRVVAMAPKVSAQSSCVQVPDIELHPVDPLNEPPTANDSEEDPMALALVAEALTATRVHDDPPSAGAVWATGGATVGPVEEPAEAHPVSASVPARRETSSRRQDAWGLPQLGGAPPPRDGARRRACHEGLRGVDASTAGVMVRMNRRPAVLGDRRPHESCREVRPMTVNSLVPRETFAALRSCVYLNQASLGLVPQASTEAMVRFAVDVAQHGNVRLSDAQEARILDELRASATAFLDARRRDRWRSWAAPARHSVSSPRSWRRGPVRLS